jgi:hypothetical protein
MALFGGKQAKVDAAREKYYLSSRDFYEEAGMLHIWEKYPEHVAQAGHVLNDKLFTSLTASAANLYEVIQIQQNFIKIRQNEEIIELLKELKNK